MAQATTSKKTRKAAKKAASRKKHVTTAYGIRLMTSRHPEVRRLKRELDDFSTHGNKVWKASYLLMDYLRDNPIPKRKRVMEVGCGWGPASIFMAHEFKAKVTAVDLDPVVFPFLQAQAALNGVKVKTHRSRFEKLRKADLAPIHTLIGSDICFWDEMVDPLFKLIRRAKKAGVKNVILTDPGRPTFDELSERCIDKLDAALYDWCIDKPLSFSGYVLHV